MLLRPWRGFSVARVVRACVRPATGENSQAVKNMHSSLSRRAAYPIIVSHTNLSHASLLKRTTSSESFSVACSWRVKHLRRSSLDYPLQSADPPAVLQRGLRDCFSSVGSQASLNIFARFSSSSTSVSQSPVGSTSAAAEGNTLQYDTPHPSSHRTSPPPLPPPPPPPQSSSSQASSDSSTSGSHRHQYYGVHLPYVTYADLERLLARRGYGGYPVYQLVLLGVVFLLVAFWSRIKLWSAKEGADVASKTLADDELKRRAEDLALQLGMALLSDPHTADALSSLLLSLLADPRTTSAASTLAADVVDRLSNDPHVVNKLSTLLAHVLATPAATEAASTLAERVFARADVLLAGTNYLGHVLEQDWSQQKGREYLAQAAVEAMREEWVKDEMRRLSVGVMRDDGVREEGGRAMWEAAKNGLWYGLKRSKTEDVAVGNSEVDKNATSSTAASTVAGGKAQEENA